MIEEGSWAAAGLGCVEPFIHSAEQMPRGGSYDRMAAAYDRIVGHPLYNRLVWGVPKGAYGEICRSILRQAPAGPLLDVGCGTLCFTAHEYVAHADRQMVLVDSSMAMLRLARDRLIRLAGRFPDHVTLVCADAARLPEIEHRFAVAVSWGVRHVLPDPRWLDELLWRSLRPGGVWAMSALVTDRAPGGAYLRLLVRSGEVAALRSQKDIAQEFVDAGMPQGAHRIGNMAFFAGRVADGCDRGGVTEPPRSPALSFPDQRA